jgi:3-dehydroquinate dehydratase-1
MDEQYSLNMLISLSNIACAEIRMERMALTKGDIAKIFSQPVLLIATCRPGELRDKKRKEYLAAAIEAGAGYVDIEVESDTVYKKEIMEKARSKGCKVIISFHDYEGTPSTERLSSIVSLCFSEGADIAKVACKANSFVDSARLIGLLGQEEFKGRVVVVGMGEKGKITRIVAPLLGSPFAFASLREGRETAEGQIEKTRLESIVGLLEDA